MPKKSTETKRDKQVVKKQPIELTEEQLEGAHGGGVGFAARQPAAKKAHNAQSGEVVSADFDYQAIRSTEVS